MYAMFTARKLLLTSKINMISLRLMILSQRQMDLCTYSANIADGVISAEEFANSSTSIFGRQMMFAQSSSMNATNQANMQLSAYTASSGDTNIDTSALYQSYYQQALKEASQVENQRVAILENEIDQEREKLETQLKAAQAELESVEKAEDKGIESSTPQYGN